MADCEGQVPKSSDAEEEVSDGSPKPQRLPDVEESPRPRKEPSTIGVALGATGGEYVRPGTANSNVEINHEVSERITRKYFQEVRNCEQERAMVYLPIDQQSPVRPNSQDVARHIKTGLDVTLDKTGVPGIGLTGNLGVSDDLWDGLFSEDEVKKQMSYLHSYAKTGRFIELYGTLGRYEGDFLYGMRHGQGTHEFRGEVYEGTWKWDHRHGWGTLTLKDGSAIKGEWQKGKPHGFTSMTDKHGRVIYEGEFKDGKRHGLGRQIFDSGDMYDGGWEEGKLHDRGVYYFTNGDKLYGMWKRGVYDGVGVFHYTDGSISRREYKDGVLQTVQDYEHTSQRFGRTLTREAMQKHTRDGAFPRDVFLLGCV